MREDLLQEPETGSVPTRNANERARSRVQVTGTAQVRRANQQVLQGKVFDLTSAGIAVFLDSPLRVKEHCELHLSLYHKGHGYTIDVSAHCSHNLLVGGRGFRNGFQFSAVNAATLATLNQICA